jgi:hypothetical protein
MGNALNAADVTSPDVQEAWYNILDNTFPFRVLVADRVNGEAVFALNAGEVGEVMERLCGPEFVGFIGEGGGDVAERLWGIGGEDGGDGGLPRMKLFRTE